MYTGWEARPLWSRESMLIFASSVFFFNTRDRTILASPRWWWCGLKGWVDFFIGLSTSCMSCLLSVFFWCTYCPLSLASEGSLPDKWMNNMIFVCKFECVCLWNAYTGKEVYKYISLFHTHTDRERQWQFFINEGDRRNLFRLILTLTWEKERWS